MPKLEIDLQLLEKLIDQLTDREKVTLVRKLEVKTLPARWKVLLRQIDRRRKKYPIKQSEIEKMVEETRQGVYERSSR